jgi:hypothetical protein
MDLTVMAAAQRHDELIADFEPECALLREALPACARRSDRGCLARHVIPVTNAARLRIGQIGLVDACGPKPAVRAKAVRGKTAKTTDKER